jgi:8-oxo-dGTP diphosphatase
LGIVVDASEPLLSLSHHYPDRSVRLMLREVEQWQGLPIGLEGQALRWVHLSEAKRLPMPAADRPIIKALGLDPRLSISAKVNEVEPFPAFLSRLEKMLESGSRFVCVPAASLGQGRAMERAESCGRMAREYGAAWIIDGLPELANAAGADGICLSTEQLRSLVERPVPADRVAMACCETPEDLARAGRLGLDLVLVGSDSANTDGTPSLDQPRLADFVAESGLPVYVWAGETRKDLATVRQSGAFGVAARAVLKT